jgi:hypothetical protein
MDDIDVKVVAYEPTHYLGVLGNINPELQVLSRLPSLLGSTY